MAAYELWNEPNLQREWNGVPLDATAFVDLVRAGATAVREVDSEAIVISGAPATTGINDGITAVDDRVYFQQIVADGITDVVDAIGAHPYGWANPHDSSSDSPPLNVPTHNDHPSFFFADTLTDYREILDQAGKSNFPIWATEFGWGSYDGLGTSPPPGLEYMAYVNEQQQASYIMGALEYAQYRDWLGPFIIWNLNFAPTFGPDFDISAYSILRPDASPRPAFNALAAIPWNEAHLQDVLDD